jgi:hypothetical protein
MAKVKTWFGGLCYEVGYKEPKASIIFRFIGGTPPSGIVCATGQIVALEVLLQDIIYSHKVKCPSSCNPHNDPEI